MAHIVDQVSFGAIVQVRDRLLEQQAHGRRFFTRICIWRGRGWIYSLCVFVPTEQVEEAAKLLPEILSKAGK